MNWFYISVIVLFFVVAILTSDKWLDKFFGTGLMEWDETKQHEQLRTAIRKGDKPTDRTVNPTYGYFPDDHISQQVDQWTRELYYDFRPEEKRGDHD